MSSAVRSERLAGRTAVELARMLASGLVSAREVVEDHLTAIGERNDELNAICTLAEEQARADAKRADDAFARGFRLGPLHGIPIVHKDVFETKGVLTTFGSPTHRSYVPQLDATVVRRCRAAGATMLGKSNTPQFATGGHTSNQLFGTTRNPVDPELTAGGSSGGAAAALAANMVPLATGSDMAGSLRLPSAFCGVVGMRPSPGRVPLWPGEAVDVGLTVAGPMARTVADTALLLSVIAGFDPRVPTSTREPVFDASPLTQPGTPMRVAWCPLPGGTPVHPEVAEIVALVPHLIEAAGIPVELGEPDLGEARECFEVLRGYQYAANYSELLDRNPDLFGPLVTGNVEKGRAYTDDDVGRANILRSELIDRTRRFFSRFDVLILPGCSVLPFPATQWTPDGSDAQGGTSYLDWLEPYARLSVVGSPVVSLPVGRTRNGLPVAVQVAAAPGRDREVLQYAGLLERLIPEGGLSVAEGASDQTAKISASSA